MPSPSPDHPGDLREVRLRLGKDSAHTSTTLTLAEPRQALDLVVAFDDLAVTTDGIRDCRVEDGVVRLRGLGAGARVVVTGRASYRASPHGLSRWTDPADQQQYVIGSGALGGAAHFMASGEGPADRMATTVVVDSPETVRAGGDSHGLASHHLGLVAGPWQVTTEPGTELLSRRSLERPAYVDALLADTCLALDWLADWFGERPWGTTYTQVLVPRASWLAMEHPGCVLLSERLLAAPRTRWVAVLAHEAAHQWLGNLVSPRTWADVGVFEGLAELLGQLACEAIVGPEAVAYVARRRGAGPLSLPSTGPDLRTLAATAGLAEVAGPVQHAELFRSMRSDVGAAEFRARVRELVNRHRGAACSTAEVWEALGGPRQEPPATQLPTLRSAGTRSRWFQLDGLRDQDPSAAAYAARQAFRSCPAGPQRVRAALSAMADPATPPPVVAGLAAELSRRRMH